MSDITRGGQFLVKETKCEDVFTPEDFSEEQIMMRDSVKEFVDKEMREATLSSCRTSSLPRKRSRALMRRSRKSREPALDLRTS